MGNSLRRARALALAVPALLLGGAYVFQYGWGLFPCQMCWWQRWPHFAALAFALLAFALKGARWPVVLAGLAILASGLIGAFHAGVEYHWWQGLTACTNNAATGTGDPLKAIMAAPLVRCDVAPWSLLGISLAGWNFLFSAGGALGVFAMLAQKGRAA